MLIQSGTKYKSLDPIQPPIELPDLVILSGLNGGGKSQLLSAIAENKIALTDGDKPLQPVRLVDHTTLAPNDSTVATRARLRPHIDGLISGQKNFKLLQVQAPQTPTKRAGVRPNTPEHPKTLVKMLRKLAENAGKAVEILSEEDIYRYYPLDDSRGLTDIFQQNFSALFKQYQVRKYENDVDQYRTQKYGSLVSLTDEEFLKVYGEPPWILINKIIANADLDYQTNFPEDRHEDAPFEFKLINNLRSQRKVQRFIWG